MRPKTVTTQQTAKRYKLMVVIAWVMIIIGMTFLAAVSAVTPGEIPWVSGALTALGGALYFYAKLKIWWHHE